MKRTRLKLKSLRDGVSMTHPVCVNVTPALSIWAIVCGTASPQEVIAVLLAAWLASQGPDRRIAGPWSLGR